MTMAFGADSTAIKKRSATRLRQATPAVVGYIVQDKFRLDLRTIFSGQDELLAETLHACLTTLP